MFCTAPNIDDNKVIKKEFGFFYNGKYYLNNKDECKSVNQEFNLLHENKTFSDMT